MNLPKFRKINVQSYKPGKSGLLRIKKIVKTTLQYTLFLKAKKIFL